MSGSTLTSRPGHGGRGGHGDLGLLAWIGGRVLTALRAPVFGVLALAGACFPLAPPLLAAAVWFSTRVPSVETDHIVNWLWLEVLLVPLAFLGPRLLAGLTRRLAGRWCGVDIAVPYRRLPSAGGAWRLWHRTRLLLTDPATWREQLWTVVNAVGVGVVSALGALPVMFVLSVFMKRLHAPRLSGPLTTLDALLNSLFAGVASPPGVVALAEAGSLTLVAMSLGLLVGPRLLTGYAGAARRLLGPDRQAELALRVNHLAATRSDTIDTGAAELRRIERDLHDGAQARLVAMGMALSAAEQLIETSPAAARALLAEAKDSSVKALAELRDLVRGIHPPVLADRGLADAVHALALDLPLRVHFAGELAGRAPAPVESAAYFTVSELLANVSKHSGADQAWIDLRHDGGTLRIAVTDNGHGGADPARGSGLRGLERRLAAFDGVLAVSSPPGGPTLVNLEIPCVLSSPKTSSS